MQKSRKKISVCLALYNGEKYIEEQLVSILAQLGPEDEVIISDDGSTDTSLEIIRSIGDQRIQVYQNTGEKGVNHNFENALNNSSGEIIFFSDQDDIWLPGKVEACVQALQTCDCIFHDAMIINADGEVVRESFYLNGVPSGGFWTNLYKTSYMACRMAINRQVLAYVLPYPSKLYCYQEGWVASMIAIKSKVKFIPFVGMLYRRHNENLSCTATSKSPHTMGKKLLIRVNLLINVIKRLIIH